MKKGLYIFILLIGFLQIIGYLTKIKIIRDLGIVTSSSPLPIVFTEVKGVETFASDFYFKFKDENGVNQKIKITPEIYSKLKGPYNRRNIFGAAIAYGPILPEKLWKSVLTYGLCNNILNEELNIPITDNEFSVLIETRTRDRNGTWVLKTSCK